jgi:hypothetical protein
MPARPHWRHDGFSILYPKLLEDIMCVLRAYLEVKYFIVSRQYNGL